MLRPALAACVVLTAAVAPDTPRYAPAAGTALHKTLEGRHTLELEDMTVVMDGNEVPAEFLPEMEMLFDRSETLEVRDRVVSAAGGRPLELLRTYETLAAEASQAVTVVGYSDESSAADASSELAGSTVRFTWDADAGTYEREFPDGGDEELLAGLEEDLDLRAFLPEDEVEVGDSWDVAGEDLHALFRPGGDLSFEWDHPGDWEHGGDGELDGSLEVRLAEVEDGVARLVVEGTVEGMLLEETDLERVPVADGDATQRSTTTWEITGELFWDLGAGHARDAALSAEMRLHIEIDKLDGEPGPSYSQTLDMVGDWSLSFAAEPTE